MAVTLNDFKSYVHAENDDSSMPSRCLAAAQSKARTAGIPAFQHNAQYDMFINALAGLYYDNRGLGLADPAVEVAAKRMVDAFVLELRYAEEDPEEPEGGEVE